MLGLTVSMGMLAWDVTLREMALCSSSQELKEEEMRSAGT